jgi:two-component sensor histidine kinase
MGMRLIEGMARSLNGTLAIEGERRTRIQVRFPLTSERNNPAG